MTEFLLCSSSKPRTFGTLQRNRSSSLILDPPSFSKDKHGQAKVTSYGNDQIWKNQGRALLVEKVCLSVLCILLSHHNDLAY